MSHEPNVSPETKALLQSLRLVDQLQQAFTPPQAAEESGPCKCPDCLAHRDPAEYGDRAKMVAAIEALREALETVLSDIEDTDNVLCDSDDDGRKVIWFALPSSTESIAQGALKESKTWKL